MRNEKIMSLPVDRLNADQLECRYLVPILSFSQSQEFFYKSVLVPCYLILDFWIKHVISCKEIVSLHSWCTSGSLEHKTDVIRNWLLSTDIFLATKFVFQAKLLQKSYFFRQPSIFSFIQASCSVLSNLLFDKKCFHF